MRRAESRFSESRARGPAWPSWPRKPRSSPGSGAPEPESLLKDRDRASTKRTSRGKKGSIRQDEGKPSNFFAVSLRHTQKEKGIPKTGCQPRG